MWCVLSLSATAAPSVVLNEIMYNPPRELDDLQYLELFNQTSNRVSLGGWSFKSGLDFVFPENTLLAPGGYLVLSKNPLAFRKHYGTNTPVLGPFKGKLKHGGEHVELITASGATADSVRFDDRSPWPLGPDGFGPSLERISPAGSSSSPDNWSASTMPQTRRAAGSPGKRNESFAATPIPSYSNLAVSQGKSGQPTVIECDIFDETGVTNAVLKVATVAGTRPIQEHEIALERIKGDSKKGRYRGEIKAANAGSVIRYRLVATNQTGLARSLPGENEPAPTFSYFAGPNTNNSFVPFAYLGQTGNSQNRNQAPSSRFFRQDAAATGASRGNSYLVYAPTNNGPIQVFDYIRIVPRKGGWKVHFRKDQPLEGLSDINLIFEYDARYVLAEHLAYELFTKSGVPAPKSGHVRVWSNGRPVGYHLLVEQPNRDFLKRTGRDESANLYKIIWHGQDIQSQHEKKSNFTNGHDDIKQIVAQLEQTQGKAQWAVIEKNFNVAEFTSYYAVNMCIQNWDGFFNNHTVYHDLKPNGKWGIIPWDKDKTWGDHDGASSTYNWYEMPLTYGMRNDKPPGDLKSMFQRGPFGNSAWWRPPGWFSGPLLANPEFRKRFLDRLQEICNSKFTEAELNPIINQLEKRLEPEVRFRAAAFGQNPSQALSDLRRHIESFRNQVVHRRKFILAELAKTRPER